MIKNLNNAISAAEKKIRKATIIAVNRAGKYAINQGIRKVQERYNIKKADFKAVMKELRAGRDETYIMRIKAKGRPLTPAMVKRTSDGVLVKHKGYKQNIKGAFIASVKKFTGRKNGKSTTSNSTSTFIFKREGKKRLPIKKLYDAQVQGLITSSESMSVIKSSFSTQFKKELNRANNYVK